MYVIVLHSKYVCDSVTLLFTESFFYKWYSSSQIMDYGQIIPSSLQIPLAINFHPRRGMGGGGGKLGVNLFFFVLEWGEGVKGASNINFQEKRCSSCKHKYAQGILYQSSTTISLSMSLEW